MYFNVLSCFIISIVTVAPPASAWPAAVACAGACAGASSLHHCQLIPGSPFTFTIQEVDATLSRVQIPRPLAARAAAVAAAAALRGSTELSTFLNLRSTTMSAISIALPVLLCFFDDG